MSTRILWTPGNPGYSSIESLFFTAIFSEVGLIKCTFVKNKFCKNFENWPSNLNFCLPYKNSETSQKKSRKGLFRPFLDTQKSNFIQIFEPGQNIMSLLIRNIQIPPPLSTDSHPLLSNSRLRPRTRSWHYFHFG